MRLSLALLLCTLLPAAGVAGSPDDAAPPAAVGPSQGLAFLRTFCFDCHGDGGSEGQVAFGSEGDFGDVLGDQPLWTRVWDNVLTGTMPPPDMPQPTAAERRQFSAWIAQEVFRLDPERPDPGRVVIRRLNRPEYRHVVNDLLAIDFDVDGHFPPDDTGYGFDTIGDVLTISPTLMEKYFQAAEQISSEVLASTQPKPPTSYTYKRKMEDGEDGKKIHWHQLDAVGDGRFELQAEIKAGKDFAPYSGTVQIDLIINGEWIESYLIDSNRPEIHPSILSIRRVIELKKGPVFVELHLRENPDEEMMREKVRINVYGMPGVRITTAPTLTGPLDGSVRRFKEPFRRVFIDGEPTGDERAQAEYAKRILANLLTRGFRRPPEPQDLQRFVGLYEQLRAEAATLPEAVCQCLTALLVSPRFLLREEYGLPQSAEIETIDEYSLASRLSFFLWSSIPDDELLGLAGRNELRRQLDQQVARMLRDSRSRRFVANFVGQWLQTRDVTAIHKSARGIDFEIRDLMQQETNLFVRHMLQENRPIVELLDARYTFLNDDLAAFYGLPRLEGSELRRVDLPEDSMRGGILTQGSVLMVTGNPNRTSPVKRGKFILENILGTPPPPPPEDVPELEQAERGGSSPKTLREMLAIHREDPACASCHNRMDPLGLAYENFDHVGRFRETERGAAIDSSGVLVGGGKFRNARELQTLLVEQKQLLYRCLTRKLLIYSLGRGLEPADVPVVEDIVDRLMHEDDGLQTLVREVIRSPQFQQRKRVPLDAAVGHHGPKSSPDAGLPPLRSGPDS